MRFTLLLLFFHSLVVGQQKLSGYKAPSTLQLEQEIFSQYPFIQFKENYFQFFSSASPNWEHFYDDLSSMIAQKDRKLNFYHIGGSHIQADIYTHDIRTFFQSNWPGLTGERGLVFPFGLAKTNNPGNYNFSSPNKWIAHKSVNSRPDDVQYGLSGAVIKCADSLITIRFKHLRSSVRPPFDRIRIYHNTGVFPFELNFGDDEILIADIIQETKLGYSEFLFSDFIDSIDVQFVRTTPTKIPLEIYGFEFLNDLPGITYNSVGINGAGLYTFLANEHFVRDLKVHPPDFFAFSLGTNDGYRPYDKFDPQVYKRNLESMINLVLSVNPDCAILLIVPNDCGIGGKPNRNTPRQREVIRELAEQYQIPVWDFYGIMGELGSASTWRNNGLMQPDLVHFTSTGYHLKGKLFIDAFLKYLDQFRQLQTEITNE